MKFIVFALAPALLAATDLSVYLETTPESALPIQGLPDGAPLVAAAPMRGAGNQFNVAGTTMVAVANIDLVAKTTFKVRLKADNGRPGGTIEKAVTITSPFVAQ